MSINLLTKPKFAPNQTVCFIGGIGKIKSIQQQDSRWVYTIEMSMGVEPDFGRVGAKTTIVLAEQDIR
ncbi:hypothetical protein C7B62_07665 [Pleurocapsa sp. CCALA 161]|uniref:hypothetical protein n=1 Tax=Pleurocapsa sp. CCALA 161 TaxID=2107688 RepID=UPI000D04AD27|nr:hypothetical protein [Pleurocapsa sp. CCALA 161]PSB10898.1 hypothetical protein C7B62_07665 [Pleurocapsa sp. CCALA 161]